MTGWDPGVHFHFFLGEAEVVVLALFFGLPILNDVRVESRWRVEMNIKSSKVDFMFDVYDLAFYNL
jgi:hypothetical protein